jgi:hypothetical protein
MNGAGGAFWLALMGSGSGNSTGNGRRCFLVKAELLFNQWINEQCRPKGRTQGATAEGPSRGGAQCSRTS